jgi:hypothetical protein
MFVFVLNIASIISQKLVEQLPKISSTIPTPEEISVHNRSVRKSKGQADLVIAGFNFTKQPSGFQILSYVPYFFLGGL